MSITSNRNRRKKKNKSNNKFKKIISSNAIGKDVSKVNTLRQSSNTHSTTVNSDKRETSKDYLNAIKAGDLEEVARLYNKGISYCEYTSLETAAINGHVNVLEFLASKGANLKRNYNGALRKASTMNVTDVVKYLVQNGSMTSKNNRSILLDAARHNNFELVKFLIENGANTKCNLKHALKESLMWNHKDISDYLISLGAIYEEYNYNVSAIDACRSNDIELINTMIQQGCDRAKLLLLAAECDSTPIVVNLIRNSSDLSIISDYAIYYDFNLKSDGSVEYSKCIMEH